MACALRPLGLGTTHSSARRWWLLAAEPGSGLGESRAVGRDAGDGDHPGAVLVHEPLEPDASGPQLVVVQLVGPDTFTLDEIRDADTSLDQHRSRVRGSQHVVGQDPGSAQRRVEAIDRMREMKAGLGAHDAGVDADEQQAQVGADEVWHR